MLSATSDKLFLAKAATGVHFAANNVLAAYLLLVPAGAGEQPYTMADTRDGGEPPVG